MIQHTNIILVGFMGSGKSTLGKKLANQLGYSFIDLDQEIELHLGMPISELFETRGEDYFREVETQTLKNKLATTTNYVMALGGGTPCFYNNMDMINEKGVSIYLKYNVGILTSRLLHAKTKRPLIANKTKEELELYIQNLLNKREKFYLKSKLVVDGNNITAQQITNLLL